MTRQELIALAKGVIRRGQGVNGVELSATVTYAIELARAFLEADAENARLRAWREGTLAERDAALALADERLAERDVLRLQVADYEKALRSECSCSGESGYNPPFDPILCDGCEALARYNKEQP